MSKIGTEEVERLAKLARIALMPVEVESMAVELGQIVEFVETLQSVKTEGIEPTNQVTGLEDVWREDVAIGCEIPQAELLKNAPERQDGYIKVRRVL